MYSKRKTFLFHNEKIVDHIENQPHQSAYLEELVVRDLKYGQQTLTKDEVIKLIKEHTKSDVDTSILSVLKQT